jgi:transcriptional regulator with XRE-family HTH domain
MVRRIRGSGYYEPVRSAADRSARVGSGCIRKAHTSPMSADFAARLNHLFSTIHPTGRKPHTNAEVADALALRGHQISKPYISQLRSGQRNNPSADTVAALATFFKVKPDYFFDDIYAAKVDHDLELLTQLQGYGLRRLSARAFDLSEESQNLLSSMAEKLRVSEGLPAVPPDSTH